MQPLVDLLKGDIGGASFAWALALAFLMGGLHALSPGHGKTLVAAYLVGSRGTLSHAVILGATVTVTHTISVFALGFATLYLTEYFMPQRLATTLSVASGISIVIFGLWLLRRRLEPLIDARRRVVEHGHSHDYAPGATLGSLLALGAGSGLAPCPSALVLMLSAVALGRVTLGLLLLVSFSLGLAAVLIFTGAAVLYARRFLPANLPQMRWMPVASAVVIIAAGAMMTLLALSS